MPLLSGARFIVVLLFFVGTVGHSHAMQPEEELTAYIDSLNSRGGEFIRSNPDSALLVLEESFRLSEKEEYDEGQALSSFLLGNYHLNRGQMDIAYQYFNESLQLNLALGNKNRQAECYNSIGDIFRRQKNFKEANRNYQLSLEVSRQMGDTILMAENINNFGDVFRDQLDYETAIIHYEKALELDLLVDNVFGITDGYNNLGDVYLFMGQYDKAIPYYNRALQLAQATSNQLEIADNLNKLGLVYFKSGDYESALYYSRLAADLSSRIRLSEELMEAYKNLSDVYFELKRFEKALESHKLYTQFQDSLLGASTVRQISELQFLYETEKKDNEIALKEAQLDAKSTQLKWLITAVVLLLILAFAFYRNFINKQRINKMLLNQQEEIQLQKQRLEEKNSLLRRLNDEKNEIIGMVAHDLRAPINQVQSVVNLMQYEKGSFSPDMQAYFEILDNSASRLNFMVSEILNIEAIENSSFDLNMQAVDLKRVIEESTDQYRKYAEKKELQLILDLPANPGQALVDENFYRNILDNLLSNAVKYSPPGKTLRVKLSRQGSQLVTSVKDEGPGLSKEDMKRVFGKYQRLSAKPTGGEASLGLGLSLVKKFTEAMGGKVWCESEKGRGAEFFVSFEKYVTKNQIIT